MVKLGTLKHPDEWLEQELNRKLAEWAGFKLVGGVDVPYYYTPDSIKITRSSDMPNFTQSLDACFKWLVPKLWVCQYVLDEGIFHVWVVSRPGKDSKASIGRYSAMDEFSSALALCLAIEKLIDGEK